MRQIRVRKPKQQSTRPDEPDLRTPSGRPMPY